MLALKHLLLVWLIPTWAAKVENCERLHTSLTYKQEKAPRDMSAVLLVVVERVNRVLEGVVDVEVEWDGGDLHGRVGEHIVECKVTRLASVVHQASLDPEEISTDEQGRDVVVQCFHIPFTILDTNECALPVGHPMSHKCHDPAICVNTVGSYDCMCPLLTGNTPTTDNADDSFWAGVVSEGRTQWELSYNSTSETSCPSQPSTHGCCPKLGHKSEGAACRSAFHCPIDPCSADKNNDCASNARCQRHASPNEKPNYQCQCPHGLMGNGHSCRAGMDPKPRPMVKFDGVTPTEETVRNNFYCGCHKPQVDACAGFPTCEGKHEICTVTDRNTPVCACRPGYVKVDGYGCVDESPPTLRLKNDPNRDGITRLKQGDSYKEHAVEIIDENAEEYQRSLKITYSKPLPPGCLTKIGEFHVNYTVATPWTSTKIVRVTRQVIIEDINECTLDVSKYETKCPELIPRCDLDSGATCVNTIGSYSCRCPKHTTGDGFKMISSKESVPPAYRGGTGCRDTSKPVIELSGPNPKVFKACKCGGLSGVMGKPKGFQNNNELLLDQRKGYENDIKELIGHTSGAELCATHRNSNPSPKDCVKASDHTYKGIIDLSSRVKVGEPLQKSSLRWSIPYNVMDDAGNEASTVWRDVVVDEVDLYDLDSKIRAEVMQERNDDVNEAVKRAVDTERRKAEQVEIAKKNRNGRARAEPAKQCPACPECICPDGEPLDESHCRPICEKLSDGKTESCPISYESVFLSILLPITFLMERVLPFYLIIAVYAAVTFGSLLLWMRLILTAWYGYFYPNSISDENLQAELRSPVYSDGVGQANRGVSPSSAPPHRVLSTGVANGIFSPPESRLYGQDRNVMSPLMSPPPDVTYTRTTDATPGTQDKHYDDSIYKRTSRITPRKR